jgi:hypothetical protein
VATQLAKIEQLQQEMEVLTVQLKRQAAAIETLTMQIKISSPSTRLSFTNREVATKDHYK